MKAATHVPIAARLRDHVRGLLGKATDPEGRNAWALVHPDPESGQLPILLTDGAQVELMIDGAWERGTFGLASRGEGTIYPAPVFRPVCLVPLMRREPCILLAPGDLLRCTLRDVDQAPRVVSTTTILSVAVRAEIADALGSLLSWSDGMPVSAAEVLAELAEDLILRVSDAARAGLPENRVDFRRDHTWEGQADGRFIRRGER